jgi:hypothetical protein
MLPEKVQNVMKCFPLVHGSSFLRDTFTQEILTKTFVHCPKKLISEYKEYMGITVTYHDKIISSGMKVAFLVISGIIFIAISAVLQKRRNVMSR